MKTPSKFLKPKHQRSLIYQIFRAMQSLIFNVHGNYSGARDQGLRDYVCHRRAALPPHPGGIPKTRNVEIGQFSQPAAVAPNPFPLMS
ncbi:MAG: hypothetical protein WAW41_13980, partial [Methylobacter sp.]